MDDRVRVRRGTGRADYEREAIHRIADAGLVAHVGTVRDGDPVVIPMFYVRDGDSLLMHGAPATGVTRRGEGATVCATITLVDGLVLARSAFHHSMNYRSLVVIGVPDLVDDDDEKAAALAHFVDALIPGRSDELRPTTTKEVRGTSVLRLSLEHASAKVRTGPPIDDEEDYELDIWAGVVPYSISADPPVEDPRLRTHVDVPPSVLELVDRCDTR